MNQYVIIEAVQISKGSLLYLICLFLTGGGVIDTIGEEEPLWFQYSENLPVDFLNIFNSVVLNSAQVIHGVKAVIIKVQLNEVHYGQRSRMILSTKIIGGLFDRRRATIDSINIETFFC